MLITLPSASLQPEVSMVETFHLFEVTLLGFRVQGFYGLGFRV